MSFNVHKKLRESLAAIRKPHHTSSHLAVLEALAYRISDKTGLCFPSEERIAAESYLSERHVRKILRHLEEDGLVEVVRSGARKPNRYRLHLPSPFLIKEAESSDLSRFQGVAKQGFRGAPQATENRDSALEALLTNKLNQSPESIRDINSSFLLIERAPSEHEALTAEVVRTGDPVQRSNRPGNADPELLKFHALFMQKLGSKTPEPSGKDVTLLTEAISLYGLGELYRVLEAVFKQKNPFWRNKLKKEATYPCSFLVSCLPTIIGQLDQAEESRRDWAQRKRQTQVSITAGHTLTKSEDEEEDDFSSFNIRDDDFGA